MIQNVTPQQIYTQPAIMPQSQQAQLPVPCIAPCPVNQAGVMPVYNSIPYNPVYGNNAQSQQHSGCYAPKISTVSIEMNGLQPPNVPAPAGFQQAQQQPVYPGVTQVAPQAVAYPSYQVLPQAPQQAVMPQPIQQVPQQEIAPPPPQPVQQAQQPQVEGQVQKPAVEQAPNAQTPEQEQEAVKPLLESLSIISPKQGQPEATTEQQAKAIQTVAQFARVAEAANQISVADPNNAEVKQTKEKVDNLIKPNLIKEETFLGLANIATKDTSKLAGEDKKKADENRMIGMWTLAMLQKLFKQEMNAEAKKINIPPISMNEIPGIVQVTDIVKKDANPDVRAGGIAALVNIADPKDKKDVETMKTILGESFKDQDEGVRIASLGALSQVVDKNNKEDAAFMKDILAKAQKDKSENVKNAASELMKSKPEEAKK